MFPGQIGGGSKLRFPGEMMRLISSIFMAAIATAFAVPAAAQDAPGYSITGVSQLRKTYSYLTLDSVKAKLRPRIAAQLPAPEAGRLVLLNVNFRAVGNADKMVELNPADLQVQWTADGARGSAPVVGVHFAKDSISWAGGSGVFTSMRPDRYEMIAVVPKSARAVDLALRQADGTYRTVKANIALAATR